MPSIHLLCGFMGFGKTTLSKSLRKDYNAVVLTHDDFMTKLYGNNPPESEFRIAYDKVDNLIWELAEKIIKTGVDVVLDNGFWTAEKRKDAFVKAKIISEHIVFHQLICAMDIAKSRVLKRTLEDDNSLDIDSNCFDMFAKNYSNITADEGYQVIYHEN